jgi:hypothetical protein
MYRHVHIVLHGLWMPLDDSLLARPSCPAQYTGLTFMLLHASRAEGLEWGFQDSPNSAQKDTACEIFQKLSETFKFVQFVLPLSHSTAFHDLRCMATSSEAEPHSDSERNCWQDTRG